MHNRFTSMKNLALSAPSSLMHKNIIVHSFQSLCKFLTPSTEFGAFVFFFLLYFQVFIISLIEVVRLQHQSSTRRKIFCKTIYTIRKIVIKQRKETYLQNE